MPASRWRRTPPPPITTAIARAARPSPATYTTHRGAFATRETGLVSLVGIAAARPDGATASLSMEVITGGTGAYANATGYIYVTGLSDENHHVSSHISGRICTP